MPKPITPHLHGVLDYVVVVLFLLAPTLFGFGGTAALLAYALAGVHLLMTVLTDFPLGFVGRVIPFRVHGTVELVVGAALAVLPWLLTDVFGEAALFFSAAGVAILLVWLLTDYRAVPAA